MGLLVSAFFFSREGCRRCRDGSKRNIFQPTAQPSTTSRIDWIITFADHSLCYVHNFDIGSVARFEQKEIKKFSRQIKGKSQRTHIFSHKDHKHTLQRKSSTGRHIERLHDSACYCDVVVDRSLTPRLYPCPHSLCSSVCFAHDTRTLPYIYIHEHSKRIPRPFRSLPN